MKQLLAGLLCFAGIAANLPGQTAPAEAPPKIQTLIITGQNGHDWRGTTPELRRILEDTGRFEVRVTEEFRGAGPETLAPYDLVVLNYFEQRKPELWWGERAQSALIDFVHSGKGRVFVTVLGHVAENLRIPGFEVTYARGAEWAATGKVTLPVPPALAE